VLSAIAGAYGGLGEANGKAACRRRPDLGRPRPWRRLDVQRPARSLPTSTTVAWNVIARVESGVVLIPGAEELAKADTAARVQRPHVRDPMVWSHGFNTRFLNIKRPRLPRITRCPFGGRGRLEALKGGTGDYAIGWKRPSKIEKKPSGIPSKVSLDGLGWTPIAHPSPFKIPSVPIRNAFGWAVGRP